MQTGFEPSLTTRALSGRGRAFSLIASLLVIGVVAWAWTTRREDCVPTPIALWRATHRPRPADFAIARSNASAALAPPQYHYESAGVRGDSAYFSYGVSDTGRSAPHWDGVILLSRDTLDAVWHTVLACSLLPDGPHDSRDDMVVGRGRESLWISAGGDTALVEIGRGRTSRRAYRLAARLAALAPDSMTQRINRGVVEWRRDFDHRSSALTP